MSELSHLPDEAWALEPVKEKPLMAEQIGTINFLGLPLRMFGEPIKPMFVGKEVCRILGLAHYQKQLFDLPQREKSVFIVSTLRYSKREAILVNEPGLYRLIFQSRKPQAAAFQDFVFSEVLPALRQFGQYPAPKSVELALRVPPQLVAFCPQDDDFKQLCLREQILVAARLEAVMEIEQAPHRGITQRCKDVAAARQGRMEGFSYSNVFKFHRRWCAANRNWRTLRCDAPPGRKSKQLPPCCAVSETAEVGK